MSSDGEWATLADSGIAITLPTLQHRLHYLATRESHARFPGVVERRLAHFEKADPEYAEEVRKELKQ